MVANVELAEPPEQHKRGGGRRRHHSDASFSASEAKLYSVLIVAQPNSRALQESHRSKRRRRIFDRSVG